MLTHLIKQKIIYSILLSISFLSVEGHGFLASTKIKKENGSWQMGQIYRNPQNKVMWVSSYDVKSHQKLRSDIKRTGKSITNCYFHIHLNNNSSYPIICTPSQEFYCAETQQWIPAYQLQEGAVLVGADGKYSITSLDFIKKPLCVYAFEVKNTHTYFVGHYAILTHNMFLPMAIGSLGISFGSGAATGATAGSFWGPITCAGGVILGGAIGIIAKAYSGLDKVNYRLDFDVTKIDRHLINTKNVDINETDAQAPGKPATNDHNGGLSNEAARKKAKRWGYKETVEGKFKSHGKPKFIKGNSIITPDRTGHNGGIWKEFDRKNRRIGTLDSNGNRIKD